MNYYELAKEIHANAVAKGFWDDPHNYRHYFMLTITELSEAVEAHRKGRTASIPEGIEDFPDKAFIPSFESHIKDTVEDELADTLIRLLDIYGYIIDNNSETYDITKAMMNNYKFALDSIGVSGEFTIWAFAIVQNLNDKPIAHTTLRKVYNSLCTLLCMAEYFDIDLDLHVRLKMRYNSTSPRLHGKKY